ncbi:MAG TPA: peptide chain release factor-like protein [Phycisphaerae bacterium]|nr:peptide chain release factor-like protein [Phycisphaerae bacterium]HRR86415.1 peptide chain release factor-like protein [Phycisphaerae bacterium]
MLKEQPNRSPTRGARSWLDLSDSQLLAQCEVDCYRASGPGGQKRNKTSSAVRLRHGPTSLIVTAAESRSQHENKARALRRLREAIAMTQRNPLRPGDPPPDFFLSALSRDPGLRVNRKNPDYYHIVQYVLDMFSACAGSTADTARSLGISAGHLIRFLKNDDTLWEHANRLRRKFGHATLR